MAQLPGITSKLGRVQLSRIEQEISNTLDEIYEYEEPEELRDPEERKEEEEAKGFAPPDVRPGEPILGIPDVPDIRPGVLDVPDIRPGGLDVPDIGPGLFPHRILLPEEEIKIGLTNRDLPRIINKISAQVGRFANVPGAVVRRNQLRGVITKAFDDVGDRHFLTDRQKEILIKAENSILATLKTKPEILRSRKKEEKQKELNKIIEKYRSPAREHFSDEVLDEFENLLYDEIDSYASGHIGACLLNISQAEYQDSFVVNKDIVVMAMLYKIICEIK